MSLLAPPPPPPPDSVKKSTVSICSHRSKTQVLTPLSPYVSSVGDVSPGMFVSAFGSIRVAVFRRVFLRIFVPSLCHSCGPPPIFFFRGEAAVQCDPAPCHSSPVVPYPRSQDEVRRKSGSVYFHRTTVRSVLQIL